MRATASVNQKHIPSATYVRWFKPYNMPVSLYFLSDAGESKIEFSGEPDALIESAKEHTDEMFFYQCGYVLNSEIINNTHTQKLLGDSLALIKKGSIEVAEPIIYADQSNSAKITREILHNNPRIFEAQFVIEAGLVGDKMGCSEGDILEAIVNYA